MIVFWKFDVERRARRLECPSKNKMSNELLLIITLIVEYSAVVLMYKYLGRDGLYLWTVLATITANIEVLILVKAFGMEMTLGNVLFATTFLVTDIANLWEKGCAQSCTSWYSNVHCVCGNQFVMVIVFAKLKRFCITFNQADICTYTETHVRKSSGIRNRAVF